MAAAAGSGIGLAIGHLCSNAVSTSVQRKVEKDVNERTGRNVVPDKKIVASNKITPEDFTKPRVESSLTRDGNGKPSQLPTTIEDVYVDNVKVKLNQKQLLEQTHSKPKEIQSTKEIATKLATNLDDLLLKIQGQKKFASNPNGVNFIMQIEIYAVSTGNRLSRFFQIGEGHVLLEVGYTLKGNHKIIKYGRIRYVDTLANSNNSSNLIKRSRKGSGEAALIAILPTIAQQLKDEIDINSIVNNNNNNNQSESLQVT